MRWGVGAEGLIVQGRHAVDREAVLPIGIWIEMLTDTRVMDISAAYMHNDQRSHQ